LRSLIKTDKETVEERALVPKNLKMMTREETQLMEMAHRLGYALTPVIKLRRELAQAIASRMINRTGENVYQSAAFSITNFPLSVLQERCVSRQPGATTAKSRHSPSNGPCMTRS